MNDTTYAALRDYTRRLADALLLRDYEVRLHRDTAGRDTNAQTRPSDVKRETTIWLNHDALTTRTPEETRQTLVHELLHAHTARLDRVTERLREQLPDSGTVAYARDQADEEEEILVDTLARVIAPFLPLPPELTA